MSLHVFFPVKLKIIGTFCFIVCVLKTISGCFFVVWYATATSSWIFTQIVEKCDFKIKFIIIITIINIFTIRKIESEGSLLV